MRQKPKNQPQLPGLTGACSACGEPISKLRPVLLRPTGRRVDALRICPACGTENWRHAFGPVSG